MLDIDHFKQINDVHGHGVGDDILQKVAKCCLSHLRPSDIAGRYGGEEFVILLPNTTITEAHLFADSLRHSITTIMIPQTTTFVTVSMGVATINKENDLQSALYQANQALYCAKQEGRNRICLAPQAINF